LLVFSIDPGVSGAICVFKNKDILEIYDVPTMVDGKKNKRQINSAQVTHIFKSFLHESDKVSVIVEQVNAMPGQRKKDSNKADAILIGKYFIDNYKNDSFHG